MNSPLNKAFGEMAGLAYSGMTSDRRVFKNSKPANTLDRFAPFQVTSNSKHRVNAVTHYNPSSNSVYEPLYDSQKHYESKPPYANQTSFCKPYATSAHLYTPSHTTAASTSKEKNYPSTSVKHAPYLPSPKPASATKRKSPNASHASSAQGNCEASGNILTKIDQQNGNDIVSYAATKEFISTFTSNNATPTKKQQKSTDSKSGKKKKHSEVSVFRNATSPKSSATAKALSKATTPAKVDTSPSRMNHLLTNFTDMIKSSQKRAMQKTIKTSDKTFAPQYDSVFYPKKSGAIRVPKDLLDADLRKIKPSVIRPPVFTTSSSELPKPTTYQSHVKYQSVITSSQRLTLFQPIAPPAMVRHHTAQEIQRILEDVHSSNSVVPNRPINHVNVAMPTNYQQPLQFDGGLRPQRVKHRRFATDQRQDVANFKEVYDKAVKNLLSIDVKVSPVSTAQHPRASTVQTTKTDEYKPPAKKPKETYNFSQFELYSSLKSNTENYDKTRSDSPPSIPPAYNSYMKDHYRPLAGDSDSVMHAENFLRNNFSNYKELESNEMLNDFIMRYKQSHEIPYKQTPIKSEEVKEASPEKVKLEVLEESKTIENNFYKLMGRISFDCGPPEFTTTSAMSDKNPIYSHDFSHLPQINPPLPLNPLPHLKGPPPLSFTNLPSIPPPMPLTLPPPIFQETPVRATKIPPSVPPPLLTNTAPTNFLNAIYFNYDAIKTEPTPSTVVEPPAILTTETTKCDKEVQSIADNKKKLKTGQAKSSRSNTPTQEKKKVRKECLKYRPYSLRQRIKAARAQLLELEKEGPPRKPSKYILKPYSEKTASKKEWFLAQFDLRRLVKRKESPRKSM